MGKEQIFYSVEMPFSEFTMLLASLFWYMEGSSWRDALG